MKLPSLLYISYFLFIGQSFADVKVTTKIDSKEISETWIEEQGAKVVAYAEYIDSLQLKHIHTYDVLFPHFKKRGEVSNSIPPKHLWSNIAETLKVVDQIATITEAEVTIIEAYRSPEYNRAVKGRSRSQLLTNSAVKVSFDDVDASFVGSIVRKLRSEGHFKGGVGVYETSVHIDTRGTNADW